MAIFLLLAGSACTLAAADTIELRDGSVRQGTIVSQTATELRLRIDRGGIQATVTFPMADIARIIKGTAAVPPIENSVPPQPATQHVDPVTTGPAIPLVAPAELGAYSSRGFLAELAARLTGEGLDDRHRLPPAQLDLWEQAIKVDTQGKRAETLAALQALEESMRAFPEGMARLEAISRRERQEGFGPWMARIHWDVMNDKPGVGQFDLKDVRTVERPALIAILRQKMTPALEPLRPYFPPTDDKTGLTAAFRPTQLQGITAANALEIKDKSLFAAAVLLGQLKLEPDMPGIDRAAIANQLSAVNRILTRARELEPAAKMALARAEIERKAAEEKARRDALIQKSRTPGIPK